jgi:subtilisin family serine protease
MMPLASTNVWAYRQSHPSHDGRGVLIGVLDSGLDAGVPGLWLTSTGERKLLDLRDFSGEGRVVLELVRLTGDTLVVGSTRWTGVGRVAALNAIGPYFAGWLAERPLGKLPAGDLNGDGDNADRLPLLVTKASDGWVLFADTDGDGSLANERPVHDFLTAKETFGWGKPAPLTLAANFGGSEAAPTLDLFFDTSGHGSHVAGIAAGADLYGIEGFDGVAPGASLLGLKIANNAYGGISVTGSMLRAIDYAIRFARERSLPLVLNMSFGVGNEREGAARIDAVIDSILAANPEIVFVTSAGNDGPGFSTMGFPGSAERAISVGATLPAAFLGGASATGDEIAFFSARGGELDKPDILAPGIAYSSVPRWNTGEETKNGTSMAAPHVAGAVGLLLSGIKQEKRTVSAGQLKQAIRASGRPLAGGTPADQGAGLLDLVAADRVVRRLPAMAVTRARIGSLAAGAGLLWWGEGMAGDTALALEIEGTLGGPIRLQSSVGWVTVPPTVTLTPPRTQVRVTVTSASIGAAGLFDATITGWATDTTIGPLFRVPVTVVRPLARADSGAHARQAVRAGGVLRALFAADSARPFKVRFASGARQQRILTFLHEPGGQPARGVDQAGPAGFGPDAVELEVDARDIVPGYYEAIAAPLPGGVATAEVTIQSSPVTLSAVRQFGDTIQATIRNATGLPAAGTAMFGLIGAERAVVFSQRGGAERRVPFRAPAWARRLVVDLSVPRDQWPWFTDLGLTVLDAEGQIVVTEPMNYATGRADVALPAGAGDRDLTVVLAPGFADPGATALWSGDLSIRIYAETPVLVDPGQSLEFALAPGASTSYRFPLGKVPWPLGDGFFPVGNLVVDAQGTLWGREVRLTPATPPVMR